MNKHLIFALIILAFGLGINRASAQEQQAYKVGLVGFYNLENLFDTISNGTAIKSRNFFILNFLWLFVGFYVK